MSSASARVCVGATELACSLVSLRSDVAQAEALQEMLDAQQAVVNESAAAVSGPDISLVEL